MVTPIEQVTVNCGKKKISRTIQNSVKAYTDIKTTSGLDGSCILLMPVLFECVDDFLPRLDEDVRNGLDGIMLFAGKNSPSLGANFDSIKSLRQEKGENFVISIHDNATPCKSRAISTAFKL